MAKRPNFLLFITDQQRADYLACAGHPVLRTPNIDSIAHGGRRFDRFYVACPICMPNRSTLMTGRMPSLHGVRQNGTALSFRANTFVDLMRAHGYRTALLGKSHLQNMTGLPAILQPPDLPDDYLVPPESFGEATRRSGEDGPVDAESPQGWRDDPDWDLSYPFYGFERVDLCTEHGDLVGGHYWQWLKERHDDPDGLRGQENALPHDYIMPQAWRTAVPEALYPTRYVAERTVDFLESHAGAGGDAPFFAMASFPDPHHPFTPPGKYWDMYRPDDMRLDASFAANHEPPPHVRWAREQREAGNAVTNSQVLFAVSEREAREAAALTCGMIAMIDDAVGSVLSALDQLGLADDTVVIFTADHGDFLGDHRIMLKGPIHYQSLIRVPFLWKDTADRGAPAGASSTLSGTLDIARTVRKIRRVENKGIVRVEDAHGAPPTIPFWLGEAPGRSMELSQAVGELRRDVGRLAQDTESAVRQLQRECHMPAAAAEQIVEYLSEAQDALQVMPSDTDVVFERFFDEGGGQQLVVHAPFGSGVNRAWGLALRKRFCVRFDFELQAAANEEGVILSLGPSQSFPLEEAFGYLSAANAEQSLRQAVLYAPFWNTRWRWAATRALAVPRRRGGREVPPYLQRMIADDLLAAVFPAQVGCQENLAGPLEVPDHPLIAQTMDDCLHEAVDTDGLIEVLERIERGEIRLHARDTVTPSGLAQSIINVNPFGFLDDAPLEERRTRAVMTRRTLPNEQRDLGKLDLDAIIRVQEEAFPPIRTADELHELLLSVIALRVDQLPALSPALSEAGIRAQLAELRAQGRAAQASGPGGAIWFAAEQLEAIRQLFPDHAVDPAFTVPEAALILPADREDARLKLVRGHLEIAGPITPAQLAQRCGLAERDCGYGLAQLEAYGEIMRGQFTPTLSPDAAEEYCDRRLLARIHRYTIARLRAEIEPVTVQHYVRFLLRWQHLTPDTRLAGKAGVRAVIEQLQGFEAPAAAWERDLIAPRVADYREAWLDELCLAGDLAWARLTPRAARRAPTKTTPIALVLRRDFRALLAAVRRPAPLPPSRGRSAPEPPPDAAEQLIAEGGAASQILRLLNDRGALFFDELVDGTRRLATDVEGGLRELVASGLAHADGFQGLRQLIRPNRRARRPRYGGGGVFIGEGPAGRWAALPPTIADHTDPLAAEQQAERIARILLQRYGVVSRELATRESLTLQWRDVLRALRRLEARGEIRGGRFIQGLLGEQFALPAAIDQLRAVRRQPAAGEHITIAASDPCNLVGILLPGQRVPARLGTSLTLIDGVPQESPADGLAAAD